LQVFPKAFRAYVRFFQCLQRPGQQLFKFFNGAHQGIAGNAKAIRQS
jgi:hypothetical protein